MWTVEEKEKFEQSREKFKEVIKKSNSTGEVLYVDFESGELIFKTYLCEKEVA